MDKKETIIKDKDGIAKTADFVAEGLTNYDVANLCKEIILSTSDMVYCQLVEQQDIREEQVLAALLPESIVCVGSALLHYGCYNDFASRQWSIAVPCIFRDQNRKLTLSVKVYFVQPALFEIGRTNREFNGTQFVVYDWERTILQLCQITVQNLIMNCLTRRQCLCCR